MLSSGQRSASSTVDKQMHAGKEVGEELPRESPECGEKAHPGFGHYLKERDRKEGRKKVTLF